jgi:hypothetical protein
VNEPTLEDFEAVCIKFLISRGYSIEIAGSPETPHALCVRLHISGSKFYRRMQRAGRPKSSNEDRGPSGRLNMITSNAKLDRYLRAEVTRSLNGKVDDPREQAARLAKQMRVFRGRLGKMRELLSSFRGN